MRKVLLNIAAQHGVTVHYNAQSSLDKVGGNKPFIWFFWDEKNCGFAQDGSAPAQYTEISYVEMVSGLEVHDLPVAIDGLQVKLSNPGFVTIAGREYCVSSLKKIVQYAEAE